MEQEMKKKGVPRVEFKGMKWSISSPISEVSVPNKEKVYLSPGDPERERNCSLEKDASSVMGPERSRFNEKERLPRTLAS